MLVDFPICNISNKSEKVNCTTTKFDNVTFQNENSYLSIVCSQYFLKENFVEFENHKNECIPAVRVPEDTASNCIENTFEIPVCAIIESKTGVTQLGKQTILSLA